MGIREMPGKIQERTRIAESGCWEWVGQINHGGYGILWKNQRAHRVTYTIAKGEIPEGLVIDHLCRNRACVNPDHLEAVTQRVNTLRGETLATEKAAQTHCIHGHKLAGDNVYRHPKRGTRHCKACDRRRDRERQVDPRRPPCAVDGCDGRATSRGWCKPHYMKWYKANRSRQVAA